MIYGTDEKRTNLRYLGPDPRVQGSAEALERLLECLRRAGEEAGLAKQSEAERKCLLQSGLEGWRLDPEALGEALQDRLGGGNEHDIFLDEGSQRVVKITQSTTSYGAQGSAYAYLTNWSRCNRFFADAIRFEGMVRREGDRDALVISQPFIVGEAAPDERITQFFIEMGFQPVERYAYQLTGVGDRDYLVADARPDNVIEEASTGLICPIDVQITSDDRS